MEARELRIGNWVYRKSINQNVRISINSFNDLTDYEPIELTEEILLKCGFVNCGILENHFYIKGMLVWKCEEMFIHDKTGVQLKHLHQLQNLYFALTNEELIINL